MNLDLWRPPDPQRTIRVGAVTAVLITIVLGAYGVAVEGTGPLQGWVWPVVAAGVLLGPLLLRSPLTRTRAGVPWWLLYVWATINVTLLGVFIALVDQPIRWSLLWAVIAVTMPLSFPWRGQLVLHGYALLWLVTSTAISGHGPVDIAVGAALYAIIAYVGGALSGALHHAVHARTADRDDAEIRARLLVAVGRMTSLDTDEVMDEVVGAIARLGFELANVGVLDGQRIAPVASLGFEQAPGPITIRDGLAGLAIREGRTVAVADYRTFARRLDGREEVRAAVATPFRVEGRIAGVVTGASRSARALTDTQVEVVETLAAHVGRSLENARRFENERLMVRRLTELDALKSDFLSNVSHELRTPLTVIAGLGEVLERRRGALDDGQVDELLGRVNANADRLRTMIDSLLDFSRVDAEGIKLQLAVVDVAGLVNRVIDRMAPLAGSHDVTRAIEPVGPVIADAALLENCVENLLGNALKHTPHGTAVTISVTGVDRHVEVAVHDDGPGIPADELPHLTDRFYRGGAPTTRGSSGLGLGLALTAEILAGHGTELDITSRPGMGASFVFRLRSVDDVVPAAAGEPISGPTDPPALGTPSSRRRPTRDASRLAAPPGAASPAPR